MDTCEEIHIGRMVRQVLKEQGRSVTWLAKELHCCRTNMYLIFEKQYLDIELLLRISKILNYNFFTQLSQSLDKDG